MVLIVRSLSGPGYNVFMTVWRSNAGGTKSRIDIDLLALLVHQVLSYRFIAFFIEILTAYMQTLQ